MSVPVAASGRRWQTWALAVIEVFVAYQAISGGVGLITDTWKLPTAWLARTPFDTWVGPGWILIGLVAVPQLLAAVPQLFLPRRPGLGVLAGLLAGANLLIWIILQLAVLQIYFFLQPVIAGFGVVEIGLALWWRARLRRSQFAA
ncbi:hypothetical protein ATK74_1453 [Propionicimonas paludicola]|uniref:DoxX-like protein n=1 Tax=Propionicimonas paludicola TaxID=185243 RepID=A0A2A9CR99_9ACTN|nr:hypothetical protein [Propionicimonas paludicola]PFG16898.1 hypothetical protein ATK74_1453 [Propionicimonas paludicola]